MHAAVPAEEHRNEASSAFPLALLQSHRSHTHAFARLTEPPGLALGLEKAENVVLANWALDVADDGAGGVVHELDADLGHATAGAGAAENAGDLDELDGGVTPVGTKS